MSTRNFISSVICISAVLVLTGCNETDTVETDPVIRPVRSIEVAPADNLKTRNFPGRIEAAEKVELAFQVSGVLNKLPIKKGQQVKAGQLLAEINQQDFTSNLRAAEAQFNKARADYNRGSEIYKKKLLSKAQLDQLRTTYQVARSELEKTRKAFNDTSLAAPFDGVIGDIYVDNFQDINAKKPVLSLQNNNELEISVQVPESLIAGQTSADPSDNVDIFAELEALPGQQFPLSIKEYSTRANQETQTFEYILTMPSPENFTVLPGMTVNVFAQEKGEPAPDAPLEVPVSAVFAAEDGSDKQFVWIINDQLTVEKRAVTIGELSRDQILVTQGLTAGERIVTAGVHYLQPQQQVRLMADAQE